MGFDPARFPRPATPSPKAGRFRIVAAGRLIPLKGYDLLIEAMAGLEGVELVLAGEGAEAEPLRRLALDRGLSFSLPGRLSPKDLAALYAGADLAVVSSRIGAGGRVEGSPLAVVEAFAQGCPVLGSRCGGTADLIDAGQTGGLFAPGDAEDLRRGIEGMRRLGASERGAMTEACRAAAAALDYRRVAARIAPLFDPS